MRILSVALALVLLSAVGALAQRADVELGAGVYFGNQEFPFGDTSGATGFYASGSVALEGHPVVLTGSYASFSPDALVDASGTKIALEHTAGVFDLLAGYRVAPYLSIGAGYASYLYSDEIGDEVSARGVAVGAFGEYEINDQIYARGKVYYVPSAQVENLWTDSGTMLGIVANVGFALRPNLHIEAGYRSLKVNLGAGESFSAGGVFTGVSYLF